MFTVASSPSLLVTATQRLVTGRASLFHERRADSDGLKRSPAPRPPRLTAATIRAVPTLGTTDGLSRPIPISRFVGRAGTWAPGRRRQTCSLTAPYCARPRCRRQAPGRRKSGETEGSGFYVGGRGRGSAQRCTCIAMFSWSRWWRASCAARRRSVTWRNGHLMAARARGPACHPERRS